MRVDSLLDVEDRTARELYMLIQQDNPIRQTILLEDVLKTYDVGYWWVCITRVYRTSEHDRRTLALTLAQNTYHRYILPHADETLCKVIECAVKHTDHYLDEICPKDLYLQKVHRIPTQLMSVKDAPHIVPAIHAIYKLLLDPNSIPKVAAMLRTAARTKRLFMDHEQCHVSMTTLLDLADKIEKGHQHLLLLEWLNTTPLFEAPVETKHNRGRVMCRVS